VLEHADLYIRKAGDEITRQLYDFKDKGDRHLSCAPS
jgi:histidyl-tRNA synthetase